jgi:hypothetical protein
MAERDDRTELSATQARAGATPRVSRFVLAISLGLVVIVMAIILLW